MNVRLTPEQEQIVKEELQAGNFRSAEEVIGHALRALREKESAAAQSSAMPEEAVREMLTFVETNHVRLEGTSVRELLHEGHRL